MHVKQGNKECLTDILEDFAAIDGDFALLVKD